MVEGIDVGYYACGALGSFVDERKVAKELLLTSHDEVVRLIKRFSDDELFEKSHFDWTGTTTLGSLCVSTTSSHYEWAIKKLRAHLKRARLTS